MGSPLITVRVIIGLAQGLNTLSHLAMSYIMLLLFYRLFRRMFKLNPLIGWMQFVKCRVLVEAWLRSRFRL